MREVFERQMESLNDQLTQMGKLCVVAIQTATQALQDGDMETARRVIEADYEIDQSEKDIENLCLKLLLEQQPVARDLRQISAALKMITDMERIGDQASDIAEIIISARMSEATDFPRIEEMSKEASKMVADSVAAYVDHNQALAEKVMENDDVVDRMFAGVRTELVHRIASLREKDEKSAQHAIDIIMVAKYLERIADHATNIAEWVSYSVSGGHKSLSDLKALN